MIPSRPHRGWHAAPRGRWVVLLALPLLIGCKKESDDDPPVKVEAAHNDAGMLKSVHVEGAGRGTDPTAAPGDRTGSRPPLAGPASESEPNDTRANATPLPVNGGLRGSLSSTIETTNGQRARRVKPDHDWYVLELTGTTASQVRVQLSPEDNSDFTLQWMTPTDAPPASTDTPRRKGPKRKRRKQPRAASGPIPLASLDSGKAAEVEVFPPTLLAPGRHYFRVLASPPRKRKKARKRPRPDEMRYRLTTTIVDPTGNLEHEPNGTRKEAGSLRPGEPREGYLGWYRDADWYRLELEDLTDKAVVRVKVTGIAGVRTRLWFVDKSGKSLVQAPERKVPTEAGNTVVIRDVGVQLSMLPYFVEVRSMRASNPHERYTITLESEVPEVPHEREPNWRPSSAAKLVVGSPIDGFVGHATDWDTYRLDAQKPMIATVVVSGVPGVDLQLDQIDANGKVIRSLNELGAGAQETLPLISVGPQAAFVRVASKGFGYNAEQGYRVAVTMVEAGDREVEPNDDFAGAGRVVIPIGKTFSGHIHPRGDADHYSLDVSAKTPDETRILTIRVTGAAGLTLDAYLYDGEKALITKKTGITPKDTRTITHGFTPGRYYLRIRDESGQAANGNEAYTIEITE